MIDITLDKRPQGRSKPFEVTGSERFTGTRTKPGKVGRCCASGAHPLLGIRRLAGRRIGRHRRRLPRGG